MVNKNSRGGMCENHCSTEQADHIPSAREGQGDGWTGEEGHSPLGRPPERGGRHHSGEEDFSTTKFAKTFQ